MWMRRITISVVGLMAGLFIASVAWAAFISGTIESVSAERRKITVKPTGDKPKQVFTVPEGVSISLDGKTVSLAELKPGQKISVFTSSSDAVTRLTVRGEESKTSGPSAEKALAEQPTAKTSPKEKKVAVVATESAKGTASDSGKSGDAPQFRGARRDGHSGSGNNIAHEWPTSGPKPAWGANGLGDGYSAVSVSNGRVFTMGLVGKEEKVFALNERDGKPVWAGSTGGGAYKDGTGDGPRGTPTLDGDRIYAMGALGDLVCLDVKSGQRRWHKNVLKEFGGNNITWGICESPLIDGEKVVVTPGGRGATMVALNKNNGNLIWKSKVPGDPSAAYASAIAVDVDGVRQYVNFTSRSMIGVRANDGEFLWENSSGANGTANCSAAVTFGNHVFYGSGYGTGGACLKLESNGNSTKAEELYKTKDMKNHHGGMVIVDGFLYGCDENLLTCIEVPTGKIQWKERSPGKGSITYADGMLIVRSEQGPVTLAEANPQKYVEKGQFDQPNRSQRASWAYPVVANGHLDLRDQDKLLCYDLRK